MKEIRNSFFHQAVWKTLTRYAVEEAVASGITNQIFVSERHKHTNEYHFDASPELDIELRVKDKLQLL